MSLHLKSALVAGSLALGMWASAAQAAPAPAPLQSGVSAAVQLASWGGHCFRRCMYHGGFPRMCAARCDGGGGWHRPSYGWGWWRGRDHDRHAYRRDRDHRDYRGRDRDDDRDSHRRRRDW